ncbi:MAG: HAD family hydrolase [Bacteroidales bacterium]|nr:HAD family hydrolase [Bacteroidales bacterium]
MAKESISEILDFTLFIFDLDNTIYNEEDYLFQSYSEIAGRFAGISTGKSKKWLLKTIMSIYRKDGREKLFDKFLEKAGLDATYLTECLEILRNFTPSSRMKMYGKTEKILRMLTERNKQIFVLTNGNPAQQRNKIKSVDWKGLDMSITFILADEIEPKPSPAGIEYILKQTNTGKEQVIFIGDSETDRECASRGGIRFLNISSL